MSETPSKRRRKGREAFIPGENPEDRCPYDKNKWGYDFYLRDFRDGWREAEEQWEAEQKEEEQKEEEQLIYDPGDPKSIINLNSMLVRGKKIYDPRDETFKVTGNPALVMADLAQNGHFITPWEFDEDFWKKIAKLADFCEE